MPRALDRDGQRALVPGAGTKLAARLDLAPLGDVAAQARGVLVIDLPDPVDAESTDLASPAKAATAAPAWPSSAATRTAPSPGTAPGAGTLTPAGTLSLSAASKPCPWRLTLGASRTKFLTPLSGFVFAHVVLVLLALPPP